MRYWDDDQPDWDAGDHDFAAVWRAKPKWVVSRTLKSVGANATLVAGDVEAFVRRLKAEVEGEIDVAGPELAGCLTDLGLIDEYRLYFRPFVLGGGKPYFAGARPPLRLIAADPLGEEAAQADVRPDLIALPPARNTISTSRVHHAPMRDKVYAILRHDRLRLSLPIGGRWANRPNGVLAGPELTRHSSAGNRLPNSTFALPMDWIMLRSQDK